MILQLEPHLPLETPRGPGRAFLVLDYGAEEDLIYAVILDESREIWCFRNRKVKALPNETFDRK